LLFGAGSPSAAECPLGIGGGSDRQPATSAVTGIDMKTVLRVSIGTSSAAALERNFRLFPTMV